MGKQKSFSSRRLALAALAFGPAALPSAAWADGGAISLVSPETVTVFGDVRAVAVNGEQSWTDGGFGKLRFGGDQPVGGADLRLRPRFGQAGAVWQPRLGWSLSGTVVALAQGGDGIDAGLSEAFLTYKPLGDGKLGLAVRAGLMWPPVSLEHDKPEWAVAETITPSAINSWIGEEVKLIGLELAVRGRLGGHALTATVATFDANDTAGALLTFRGWALHDRSALAFRRQPLPPLNDFIEYVQPRYSHPLLEVDGGLFRRPGYYAKLTWELPVPVRVEGLHYDNNGDPEAVNAALEWGWRTSFDTLGIAADVARDWQVRAQALAGRTRMGDRIGGVTWIDMRFRAGYALLTRRFARGSVSARLDVFGTRNHGSAVTADDNEDGWAATIAARRQLNRTMTGLVEFLHVDSRRDARLRLRLAASQQQDQLQMAVRVRW